MFFRHKYKRMDSDIALIKHHGIFRRRLTLFQAVAMIVSITVGAGVLGIPYVVAKVGLAVGISYIVGLGLLMMFLNLLVGEICARTKSSLQLVGLARKYLGKTGGFIMTFLVYLMSFGILVVYIIGEGETLTALFGGDPFYWSLLFFAVGSILILVGMKTIKTVEFFLSLAILFIVILIAGLSAPHIELPNIIYSNLAYLLLPYGVILFAFTGSNAIPEVHALLKKRDTDFKKAIIIAGLISIVVYVMFAFAVVGVTGAETTEIATIGLGNKLGKSMLLFGNVFALLAMGTSFLMVGLSVKDSMRWDYKIPDALAAFIVSIVPLVIFMLGLRNFIKAIDIVGGVFVSLEMMLLVLVYWRAKQLGDLKKSKYRLHHALLLSIPLLLALAIGAVYSVMKLF
ncbi:MAG: amino acid permease [Candidatus Magasanikbacteria bacterium]|mgnify:CR=1 FL=1|jgi:tyrosine-specific transport protein|nr:amino acid permease [Candidatus Magasanikbacteria bacterium]MBT4314685.1 amino acid permease [Candidatus Magasanikbacteria bacterium]MBT4547264.1 amino acid permease [Candidatus Magasanikbacteria bacterium]MBT6819125.1 amino acid permease [Candidatus Magasanikbacteria bacterium]